MRPPEKRSPGAAGTATGADRIARGNEFQAARYGSGRTAVDDLGGSATGHKAVALPEPHASPSYQDDSPEDRAARSQFTSEKLTWIDAVLMDRGLTNRQKVLAVYIAQRINWRRRTCTVSDGTVADETGIARSAISMKDRKALVERGWIKASRPHGAAPFTYELVHDRVSLIDDIRVAKREQRQAARRRRAPLSVRKAEHLCEGDSVLEHEHSREPECSQTGMPSVHVSEHSGVHVSEHKHILINTYHRTHTEQAIEEEIVEGQEQPLPAVSNDALAECRLIDLLGDGDTERGLLAAERIGSARFETLCRFLTTGDLLPSQVTAAMRAAGFEPRREDAA